MPGFYACKCDAGFTRTSGKCVKGKKKKKIKSEEEKKLDDIDKGRFFQEWHMKVGSLLYAVFFGLLVWAFSKRSTVGVISLIIVYLGVLFAFRAK